jgi:hypothetical protein
MPLVEVLGYVASGFVFTTFWMTTMIPLRIFAIVSNILFLCYGVWLELFPIMLLHGALLPLNALRLNQAIGVRRRIRQLAHSRFEVEALLPLMREQTFKAGEPVFLRGEPAEAMFYVLDGKVRVVELDLFLEPGAVFGEIALFAPDRRRTQTVVCAQDCVLMTMTEERVFQHFADNPEFSLSVVKMIVERLLKNQDRVGEPAG